MQGRESAEVANLINREYRDRPLGDLISDAEKVADLQQHPGWALVEEVLDRLGEHALLSLDAGQRPLEQAQYAQRHGFRNGLRVALDVIETFRSKGQDAEAAIEQEASRPEAAERT